MQGQALRALPEPAALEAAWQATRPQLRAAEADQPGPLGHAGFVASLHENLHDPLLASVWQVLERDGVCLPFQTFEFVETFFTYVAPHAQATPVVVRVDDAASGIPVAVLPLLRRRRHGLLVFEGADLGLCDYLAPVMHADLDLDEDGCARFWDALLRALPAKGALCLKKLPERVAGRRNPLAFGFAARPMGIGAVSLPLCDDAETSLFNRNTRKHVGRITKLEGYRYCQASTPEEADAFFDVILEQRRRRCREQGIACSLDAPGVEAFYRDLARRGVADGRILVQAIRVGEEWVASLYGFVRDQRFTGIITTIGGERWQKLSAGHANWVLTIRWALERGLTAIDFGVGQQAYKRRFGGAVMPVHEAHVVLSPSGLPLVVDAGLRRVARRWLRHFPQAGQILQRFAAR